VAEESGKLALDTGEAFDVALRRAIRDQARSKGFEFKDEAAKTDS
jgi:hypothetical protein